jgi:hypothetical protein
MVPFTLSQVSRPGHFKQLQTIWTPVFTGVMTFYEFINSVKLKRAKVLQKIFKLSAQSPSFINPSRLLLLYRYESINYELKPTNFQKG